MTVPILLAFPALLGAPTADEIPPFAQLARDYLQAAGVAEVEQSDTAYADFVSGGFDHLRLGALEVHVPFDALSSKDDFEDLQDLGAALLDAQRRWLLLDVPATKDWDDAREQLDEDLELIAKWVGGLRFGDVKRVGGGGVRVFEALEPKRRQAEALERMQAALEAGTYGVTRPVELVLLPTRERFVQLVSAIGLLRPELRENFWVEGIADWSTTWIDDTRVVALVLDDPGVDDYTKGLRLDIDNPLAMREQVVQIAHRCYLDARFQDRIDGGVAAALANTLVIEQFGEVDTRTDGDLSSRRTEARSVFVPGGRSEGGTLPKDEADGPWREGQGADHFVAVLMDSLKAGSGMVRDRDLKHRTFRIWVDADGVEQAVSGPFLGPEAVQPALEPGLEGEWLEFMRAYRTCFVHYLREAQAGKERTSRARFATFLRAVGELSGERSVLDALLDVFEQPLSDADCSKESLEGSFLRWLRKQ